jgi:hypothetical protein
MRHASLLLLLLLAACSSPGYRGLWQPKPAEASVSGADGAPIARLDVAVLGLWSGDPWDGQMHVRFRIEDTGTYPLRLPLARCEAFSGDLQPFSAPQLVSGEDQELQPGGVMVLDVGFAQPVVAADLRGLQVRWTVLAEGHEFPGSISFSRADSTYPYYYGGYGASYGWDPWYGGWHDCWHDPWGGTVVIVPSSQVLAPHTSSLPGH